MAARLAAATGGKIDRCGGKIGRNGLKSRLAFFGTPASMTNLDTSTRPDQEFGSAELANQFASAVEKKQLELIDQLVTADAGCQILLDHLQADRDARLTPSAIGILPPVVAKAYQSLYSNGPEAVRATLQAQFPQGIVPLRSDLGIDYQPLQKLLVEQDWLAADRLNNIKLCEIAGPAAVARKWVYFTDVISFPVADLRTLNALWMAHSEGKFGYSVQREIWLTVGQSWDKLWPKLNWKDGNAWTRYPGEFVWNLSAPRGHLPLTNQLRGVRVMGELLRHPAWTADQD
jgi:GUN4-like/ARM-like repeat domain, GUN4-N terminal